MTLMKHLSRMLLECDMALRLLGSLFGKIFLVLWRAFSRQFYAVADKREYLFINKFLRFDSLVLHLLNESICRIGVETIISHEALVIQEGMITFPEDTSVIVFGLG